MKKSGIPLKQFLELSSNESHQAFLQRDPEWLKNSITLDQKEKLEDLTFQLNLLKRLMDGEEIDD